VVERQDEPQRRVYDGWIEDLARVGAGCVEAADRDRLPCDEPVVGVEVQGDQMLLARPANSGSISQLRLLSRRRYALRVRWAGTGQDLRIP